MTMSALLFMFSTWDLQGTKVTSHVLKRETFAPSIWLVYVVGAVLYRWSLVDLVVITYKICDSHTWAKAEQLSRVEIWNQRVTLSPFGLGRKSFLVFWLWLILLDICLIEMTVNRSRFRVWKKPLDPIHLFQQILRCQFWSGKYLRLFQLFAWFSFSLHHAGIQESIR